MQGDRVWPPSGPQSELLARLALLIERGGPSHFLDGPVAHADARDFPDPWEPRAAAVERLLVRLLWLAHVDLDVELDDLRRFDVREQLVRRSQIDWIETRDGVAHFQIEEIGNDDVAGMLCHEVGMAYAAWLAGAAPYRDVDAAPSERDGSVAAIYLGLGVVATNAALYNIVASKTVGQMSFSQTEIVERGGLSQDEATYLLAIQAALRDDVIAAHATLREDLRELVAATHQALRPHRVEIAAHLGLDLEAPRARLERDPEPAAVAMVRREPAKTERFTGERTYRLSSSHANTGTGLGMLGGVVVGAVATQLSPYAFTFWIAFVATIIAGAIAGALRRFDRCVRCGTVIPANAGDCRGCGATVAGRIDHPRDYAARELAHGEDPAAADDDGERAP